MGFFKKLFKAIRILAAPVTFGMALSATALMATGLVFVDAVNYVEAKVYRRSTSKNVYFNPAIAACAEALRGGLKSVWTDFGIYAPLELSRMAFGSETREPPFFRATENNSQHLEKIHKNYKLLEATGKHKKEMYETLCQPDSLESRTRVVELLEKSLEEAPKNRDKISPFLAEAKKRVAELSPQREIVNPLQTEKAEIANAANSVNDVKENIAAATKTGESTVISSDLAPKEPEKALDNKEISIAKTNVDAPSNAVQITDHSKFTPEITTEKGQGNSSIS